jgi:esterase/lipase
MKTFAIFLCIALLIPCSINADQDKTKQELQTAKQVLSIMKEQMQQLTDRFKKNTLTFKGQYEQQTKQILTGFRKQLQALKQDITSIENNLDDLSSQLELQAKENDKALQAFRTKTRFSFPRT